MKQLKRRLLSVKESIAVISAKAMGRISKLLTVARERLGDLTSQKTVTLDMDGANVRLMESSNGVVKRWASIPFSQGSSDGGTPPGQPPLGTVVKQLMASSGIRAKKVVAGVSGLYSINRILPLDYQSGLSTEEAVMQMAQEVMPLAEDRLYLSWQMISENEDKRQAMVIGVPRGIIDGQVRPLKAAGISSQVLELRAMSLARAANREKAIILNVDYASFDVVIIANGLPEIMRTLAFHERKLTAEERVEHLQVSLDLTTDFYDSQHPEMPLDPATPLFITGALSGDMAFMEKLQPRLRYPVAPLAPPLQYPEHMPASQFAVNIGLALRDEAAAKKKNGQNEHIPLQINLLPKIYNPWRPTARQISAVVAIVAAAALLMPLLRVTQEALAETASLELRLAAFNAELQRRQAEIKSRVPLQKAVDEYRTIVNMGGGLTDDLETIKREAEELGVDVVFISHKGTTIDIDSRANDYTSFRSFLMALEESGRFASPIPPPEGYPYTRSGLIKLETVAR